MSQISKEWMDERNRVSEVYTKGIEDFINFAIANNPYEFTTFPCPCAKCRNKIRTSVTGLKRHLVRNGMDRTYTRWVLHGENQHGNLIDDLVVEDVSIMKSNSSGKGKEIKMTEMEKQTSFIPWLYDKLVTSGETETKSILWRLVQGPKHKVTTYRKFRANGYVFSPKYHDDGVVTQDSGVCMKAWTKFRARKSDTKLKDAWVMWYGVIKQIIELDYTIFKQVVFYCDWVRIEDNTNGCKHCPDSNLVMVNFDKFKSSSNELDEPVILASEENQIFYSKDLKNPNWWVVIHSPKRLTSRVDDLEIPTTFQSTLEDQPHLETILKQYGSS